MNIVSNMHRLSLYVVLSLALSGFEIKSIQLEVNLVSQPFWVPNSSDAKFLGGRCSVFDQEVYGALSHWRTNFRLASWQDLTSSTETRSQIFDAILKDKQAIFSIHFVCENNFIEASLIWKTTDLTFNHGLHDYFEAKVLQTRGYDNALAARKQLNAFLTIHKSSSEYICRFRESILLSFIEKNDYFVIQTFKKSSISVVRALTLVFVKDQFYLRRREFTDEIKFDLFWTDPGGNFQLNDVDAEDLDRKSYYVFPKNNTCVGDWSTNSEMIGWMIWILSITTAIVIFGVCIWYGFCRKAKLSSVL